MSLIARVVSPGAPIKGQTPSYQWFLANSSPSTPELAELFRQARACDVEIYIIEKAHALKTKAIEKVVLDFQEKVREYGLKALEEAKGHTLRLNQQVAARQNAIQASLANYLSLQATQTSGQISGQQSAYLQILRALQVLSPHLKFPLTDLESNALKNGCLTPSPFQCVIPELLLAYRLMYISSLLPVASHGLCPLGRATVKISATPSRPLLTNNVLSHWFA